MFEPFLPCITTLELPSPKILKTHTHLEISSLFMHVQSLNKQWAVGWPKDMLLPLLLVIFANYVNYLVVRRPCGARGHLRDVSSGISPKKNYKSLVIQTLLIHVRTCTHDTYKRLQAYPHLKGLVCTT